MERIRLGCTSMKEYCRLEPVSSLIQFFRRIDAFEPSQWNHDKTKHEINTKDDKYVTILFCLIFGPGTEEAQ